MLLTMNFLFVFGLTFVYELRIIQIMAISIGLVQSSLVRKYWMALTGLFLCSFLVVHLLGNLPLLTEDRESFNSYAHFMVNFPLIKIISYGLYLSIVLHSVDGLLLARSNKKARETSYVQYNGKANASWSSRNMAILGTLTLVFLIIHMKSFWYEMHFGYIPIYTNSNGNELKDLYSITVAAFKQPWYSIFYVFAMMGLGFHLWHGFASSFQTLGINHAKYTPFIEIFGKGFSVIISLAFASIPLYILFS